MNNLAYQPTEEELADVHRDTLMYQIMVKTDDARMQLATLAQQTGNVYAHQCTQALEQAVKYLETANMLYACATRTRKTN